MDPLEKRVEYLRTWLERHRSANKVAPAVQEALDQAEWELGVVRDRPPEAINLSTTEIDVHSGIALRQVTEFLPMMPDYHLSTAFRINSISTSSSSAAFTYVHDVGMIGTPAAVEYSLAKADQYRVVQELHRRRLRVRELILDLVPRAEPRLDAACTAVDLCRIGVIAKSAAASELRNLVDGIQGELFEIVRRSPREHVDWETMSERLLD